MPRGKVDRFAVTQEMIRSYGGKRPEIAPSAYVDPAAVIIGDVEIGEDSSVWPCAVLRGDATRHSPLVRSQR